MHDYLLITSLQLQYIISLEIIFSFLIFFPFQFLDIFHYQNKSFLFHLLYYYIYILRHGLQANLLHCGLFAGLQDKRLGKVLEQLFNAPQQAWNMDALAALAAMSRANFMRVFQQKIGMAPGKFLTQLRL